MVRQNRRVAAAEFAPLWPTLSAGATGPVDADGGYKPCDALSTSFGYEIIGVVHTADAATPSPRIERMLTALRAQGWHAVEARPEWIPGQVLLADKAGMQLRMSAFDDSFGATLKSACAPVTLAGARAIIDDQIAGKGRLKIPGVPTDPPPR